MVKASGSVAAERETGTVARFTAQLVALCLPDRKARVETLHERYNISRAAILRAVIDHGLPIVEAGLADGSIDAGMLP